MIACPICNGTLWVCEAHPLVPWNDGKGCCGAAGMPCRCNPTGKVEWDEVICSADQPTENEQ